MPLECTHTEKERQRQTQAHPRDKAAEIASGCEQVAEQEHEEGSG